MDLAIAGTVISMVGSLFVWEALVKKIIETTKIRKLISHKSYILNQCVRIYCDFDGKIKLSFFSIGSCTNDIPDIEITNKKLLAYLTKDERFELPILSGVAEASPTAGSAYPKFRFYRVEIRLKDHSIQLTLLRSADAYHGQHEWFNIVLPYDTFDVSFLECFSDLWRSSSKQTCFIYCNDGEALLINKGREPLQRMPPIPAEVPTFSHKEVTGQFTKPAKHN